MSAKTVPKNYQYVTCRTFGHAWEPSQVIKDRVIGQRVVLECTRCGMLRLDGVGVKGEVITRSYSQPEGYKLGKGHAVPKTEWRKKWIKGHSK